MVNTTPNPIKPHYIAYFDILGYKDFFANQPEKAEEFLNVIHQAVQCALASIRALHQSPMISQIAKMDFKIKVFSDNFFICLETTDMENESVRLLTFLQTIADIQSALINDYGLFVRGCIIKGDISFNEDYVFGKGLIDAVYLEEKVAKYPRIIVPQELVEYLMTNHYYTQEEIDKAIDIEARLQKCESVSSEEQGYYVQMSNKMKMLYFVLKSASTVFSQWPDGNWFVSYLQRENVTEYLDHEFFNRILQFLKVYSPEDYQAVITPPKKLDSILEQHKNRVEEQLIKFGNNHDLTVNDSAIAEGREYVLRKYLWSTAYHNYVCEKYSKLNYRILPQFNCDSRFLKMIVKVQNDEPKV